MDYENENYIKNLEKENKIYRTSHAKLLCLTSRNKRLFNWLSQKIIEERNTAEHDLSTYTEGRIAAYQDVYNHIKNFQKMEDLDD